MRVLRWIGRALLGVVALVIVGIGAVYAQSQRLIAAKGDVTRPTVRAAVADSATLARGATLMEVNGCTGCHAANLGGNVMLDEPLLGRLVGSNLTKGRGGILHRYDDRALDVAIRDGMGWDGRKLAVMPAKEFSHLADDDVAALLAYLRAQQPVDKELPAVAFGPAFRAAIALGKFPFAYDSIAHSRVTLPIAPRGATREHGEYLVSTCTGCHGEKLAGGPVHGSDLLAPNITPRARISQWSLADFTRLMREGVRPDRTPVNQAMPWRAFAKYSNEEIESLYLYLNSVPRA